MAHILQDHVKKLGKITNAVEVFTFIAFKYFVSSFC